MIERVKVLHPEDRVFFSRWLQNPLKAGAVIPSGPSLARLMAAQVDTARPGTVVELGGGTGRITAALVAAGVAPANLLVVEQDERLHDFLETRFPEAHVVLGDAGRLDWHLRQRGLSQVNAVVSGLPLLLMPRGVQKRILEQAFAGMEEDGVFVQFTYGFRSPIPRGRLARWGYRASLAGIAWVNIPPAAVWRITRV